MELERLPLSEYAEWLAYFRLLEREKEDKEAKEKSKDDVESFRNMLTKGGLLKKC